MASANIEICNIIKDFLTCVLQNSKTTQIEVSIDNNIPAVIINGTKHEGMRNVLSSFKTGESFVEECAAGDWAEFCLINLAGLKYKSQSERHTTLEGFNSVLRDRTCLVGHRVTTADVLVYFFMVNIIKESKTAIDRYVHIKRWSNFINSVINQNGLSK